MGTVSFIHVLQHMRTRESPTCTHTVQDRTASAPPCPLNPCFTIAWSVHTPVHTLKKHVEEREYRSYMHFWFASTFSYPRSDKTMESSASLPEDQNRGARPAGSEPPAKMARSEAPDDDGSCSSKALVDGTVDDEGVQPVLCTLSFVAEDGVDITYNKVESTRPFLTILNKYAKSHHEEHHRCQSAESTQSCSQNQCTTEWRLAG